MTAAIWADRLIGSLDPSIRDELARDPALALKQHFKLSVQATNVPTQRGQGGWCDGLSIREDHLIIYVPAHSRPRERFTLLHELGHFLTAESEEFIAWVVDQKETARIEEDVCNQIAAGLLLPSVLVDELLAGENLAAQHVVALFDHSRASRAACIVALSRRLGTEGFIALIDREHSRVLFSARNADTHPYAWKGDLLTPTHPLRKIQAGVPLRSRAWWPRQDGTEREMWMDAVADDRYIYAVFAARDLWQTPGLHVLDVDPQPSRGFSTAACVRTDRFVKLRG